MFRHFVAGLYVAVSFTAAPAFAEEAAAVPEGAPAVTAEVAPKAAAEVAAAVADNVAPTVATEGASNIAPEVTPAVAEIAPNVAEVAPVATPVATEVATSQASTPAPEPEPEISPEFINGLRKIFTSRVATISIRAQNERYADITQNNIDDLNKQWRAEANSASQPLIAQLMGNPLSSYLIRKKAESLGLYTEIFVLDAKGLNVGQSSVTSDFWHGDEPKYQNTFIRGPDAVLIDKPGFDEATKSRRQQVSFPIIDPETNEMLGAATVEINIDEMARRSHLAHSS